MKRSAALVSLSHDHHQALVAAQVLRRSSPDSASAACRRFLQFWPDGRRHFDDEEQLLFPAYVACGDPRHPLLQRALQDHVAIRATAAALAVDPAPSVDVLHDLGERLAAHVRLEERELFPLIEETVPAERLADVAVALDRSDRSAAD